MGIDEQILVLVMSANRPQAVRNHLNQLLRSVVAQNSSVIACGKEFLNAWTELSFSFDWLMHSTFKGQKCPVGCANLNHAIIYPLVNAGKLSAFDERATNLSTGVLTRENICPV